MLYILGIILLYTSYLRAVLERPNTQGPNIYIDKVRWGGGGGGNTAEMGEMCVYVGYHSGREAGVTLNF